MENLPEKITVDWDNPKYLLPGEVVGEFELPVAMFYIIKNILWEPRRLQSFEELTERMKVQSEKRRIPLESLKSEIIKYISDAMLDMLDNY